MTGKGLTSLWAYAVGEGSVEGGRIRRQNGQIHEFDQHYKMYPQGEFQRSNFCSY